ncbi:hypothetical protein V8F06_012696 [Rhypophila decipiens]
MKFHDLVLLLTLSLTTAHAAVYIPRVKGVYFPFPPKDFEDLEDIYVAIPQILKKTWPISELFTLWQPNFQLFISDARNPWVTKHFLRLNSQKDITTALCTLNSSDPSRQALEAHVSSRGIGPLPSAKDLFSKLEINNNRAGVNRWSGWQNAIDRLKEMLNCPAALENLRELEVDIFAYDFERGEARFMLTTTFIKSTGETVEVAEISSLFAQLLMSAPKLERVNWQIPCEQTQFFERDFDRMGVEFKSIRQLTLGPFSDYMFRFTPGLESLESGRYWSCQYQISGFRDAGIALVKAVLGLPLENRDKIRRLDLKPRWDVPRELVIDILEAMPNLTELSLEGKLERKWEEDRETEWDLRYRPGLEKLLKSYLTLISHLPNLRKLGLPPASELGLGFDGGAWCGNAYFGPSGRAYGRQVSRERAKTVEIAARFTLEEMPYLSELSIGGTRAALNDTGTELCTSRVGVITGHGGSKVPEVRWPWTGRMKEWTYEQWPEPKPGAEYDDEF